jgi:hypothetical protein
MTVTNQNCLHEEDTSADYSGNACYQWAQNLLSSNLLPINIKVKVMQSHYRPGVAQRVPGS